MTKERKPLAKISGTRGIDTLLDQQREKSYTTSSYVKGKHTIAHQGQNEACDWTSKVPDKSEGSEPRDARNALARQLESYKEL